MQDISKLSREQLEALVTRMVADKQAKLTLKVSEKGAVSVYGMGKWPVTLYLSQWEAFIPFIKSGAVERFIELHQDELSVKGATLADFQASADKAGRAR